METLPIPPKEAIIYEDDKLYVCLASFPLTKGHSIVVWKQRAPDLHLLSRIDYEYLMDMTDAARNALMETYKVEKVYLMYMDEVKQVHWHLIPRYEEMGFNVLSHQPLQTSDFSDAPALRDSFAVKAENFRKESNLPLSLCVI